MARGPERTVPFNVVADGGSPLTPRAAVCMGARPAGAGAQPAAGDKEQKAKRLANFVRFGRRYRQPTNALSAGELAGPIILANA